MVFPFSTLFAKAPVYNKDDMKNAEPGIYLVNVNGPAGRATGKLIIE